MAKIPFDIKYRPQIESGEYKVGTRDGRLVHDIWWVKAPYYTNNRKAEVCALIDGEEDALVFFEGGRYLPATKDIDNPFDLFIITPEQELTPFEDGLRQVCEEAVMEAAVFPDRTSEDFAKDHSAKLLALAREELFANDAVLKEYAEVARERGKAEALKDLPRWERDDSIESEQHITVGKNGERFHYKGHSLLISNLEKLPGFKED